jgi:hypothetical protein
MKATQPTCAARHDGKNNVDCTNLTVISYDSFFRGKEIREY